MCCRLPCGQHRYWRIHLHRAGGAGRRGAPAPASESATAYRRGCSQGNARACGDVNLAVIACTRVELWRCVDRHAIRTRRIYGQGVGWLRCDAEALYHLWRSTVVAIACLVGGDRADSNRHPGDRAASYGANSGRMTAESNR